MDSINGAPLPSGSWLGSNNMEPGRSLAGRRRRALGCLFPGLPFAGPLWGEDPSSCQMGLSTQYSVSGFRSPICPSPFRPRGGDSTQLFQPQGTERALWFPQPFVNSSFTAVP